MTEKKPSQRRRGPHGPSGVGEKPQNFSDAWKKLLNYMHQYRAALIAALIMAALSSITMLYGPNVISDITNIIGNAIETNYLPNNPPNKVDVDAVVSLALKVLAVYAIGTLFAFGVNYIMAGLSQKTASGLRRDIAAKANRVPLRILDRSSTGDLVSRVTNDADTIGQSLNQSLGTMVSALTLLFGSIIMMFWTNGTMAVTAILSTLLGVFLMFGIMHYSQRFFNLQQQNLGVMNGLVEEVYAGHDVVRVYNGERSAKQTFDRINGLLAKSAFRSQFLGGTMQPLMNFVGNFGYVMVCIVGAVLTLNGSITFGIIVAFMIYVRLFTQPLAQLGQAFQAMQSVAAAAERVFGFLATPEMEDERDKPVLIGPVKGAVEFRNIHFGYDQGKEIIHGFSAKIQPGQKVAIVGPTGAGKTTIVNLLMRFYEADSGEILIDGVPTLDMSRQDVRRQFGMVLQDTWIFRGTVRENIVYCKEGVTEDQLITACQAVGLYHYIQTLPQGFDTVLNDGSALSVGQRQQLTIARAMVQNAPLMILDEATSSVDTRTERTIQKAMDRLTQHRTSFVIAHRLSTIRNADLILVMKEGSIIEQGTHDQLLAQSGFYCDLYNSQFDEGESD